MRSALAAVLVVCVPVASAAVVVGCSSSSADDPGAADGGPETGVTETGAISLPDAGAADAQPFPFGQVCKPVVDPDAGADVCKTCAMERCCDTRDAILGTDAGVALVDCIADGGDCGESCYAACFADHSQQVRPYLDHFSCLSHRCLDECASPVNPCSACLDEQCTLDVLACNLSPTCFLITACGAACDGDVACLMACAAKYPDAARLQTNLTVCGTNRCPNECTTEK